MEIGRITFYNTQSGDGKIILESEKKFDFSIDVWNDFKAIPVAGALVECTIKDGVIEGIKSLEDSVDGTPKVEASLEKSLDIENRVEKSLKSYFKEMESALGEPPKIVKTEEQLDYLLSKRFLMTAYNNLKNFDPSLHDHKKIKEKMKIIAGLEKAYYSAKDKIDVPMIAFETIFLRSQIEYIDYIAYKEKCLSRISILSILEDSLPFEIKEKEAELKKFKESNKKEKIAKIKITQEIKVYRGKYVDTIEEKVTLFEELNSLEDVKKAFTEKYFESFNLELTKKSYEYQKVILKILHYKAYELNELIWMEASSSDAVQEYFNSAGIEGDYSITTYLRYYISNLDKSKLGDEQRDLLQLLKYLEHK